MNIPEDIIPLAYKTSKRVYEDKLSLTDGISLLSGGSRMNANSARDYIYNFRCLMDGRVFHRTLNTKSMEYFFQAIFIDYGTFHLKMPLKALDKHIHYYEGLQGTTMHQMRAIHKKYLDKCISPTLIQDINQLKSNIRELEHNLIEGDEKSREVASNLIKNGACFVAYKINKEIRFAPSRFLGYENNRLDKYSPKDIDGRDTNPIISELLNTIPTRSRKLEESYLNYCKLLGIKATQKHRKYWLLELEAEFDENIGLTDFPEGNIIERRHKARERNSQVIEIAKQLFKQKHGRLYCEVCKTDFGKKYGRHGEDFIEGHHTIFVSEMPPDYKTKPEEIAMVCSNCHRMIHRKRPWLTKEKLGEILRKRDS